MTFDPKITPEIKLIGQLVHELLSLSLLHYIKTSECMVTPPPPKSPKIKNHKTKLARGCCFQFVILFHNYDYPN